MLSLSFDDLANEFPYPEMRASQEQAFHEIAAAQSGVVAELGTGEGKTAIMMTALKAVAKKQLEKPPERRLPVIYVTPTKTLVEQVCRQFPNDTVMALGRSEHPCLYYEAQGETVNAADSPCYMLKCRHRVDMDSGMPAETGADPCPYYLQKFQAMQEAKNGKILVCTTAYFLIHRTKVKRWREGMEPACVAADEGHNLARIARSLFEYSLTDYHLCRLRTVMRDGLRLPEQADILDRLLRSLRSIASRGGRGDMKRLSQGQVQNLLSIMEELDVSSIESARRQAMRENLSMEEFTDREVMKLLEHLCFNIRNMVRGLRYSLEAEDEDRNPLNYVVAFYWKEEDMSDRQKVKIRLTIRSYYVASLIRKALGKNPIVMSATIGDAKIFNWEVGLRRMRIVRLPSSFPIENTRMIVPNDMPSLARRDISTRQYNRVVRKLMRNVIEQMQRCSEQGHRSLMVVVSEEERKMFAELAEEAMPGDLITYNENLNPREAARLFRMGRGSVLLGTVSQYGEGVDLPSQMAPFIYFLKPGYPHPDDPQAQFEQERYGRGVWALWKWRVMIRALQVRGRNIRSASDMGVTIFLDWRFNGFVVQGAPEWLKPAYRNNYSLDDGVTDSLQMLRNGGAEHEAA